MKNFIYLLLLSGLLLSCSKEVDIIESPSNIDVDAAIKQHFATQNTVFEWKNASRELLWAAIQQGDNIVTVGFGQEGEIELAADDQLTGKRSQLLAQILELENQRTSEKLTLDDIQIRQSSVLTYFDVFLKNKATLAFLMENANVRFVEPGNYIFNKEEKEKLRTASLRSGSFGCGTSAQTIDPHDYTVESPAAWVPWNFYLHNIPQAWNISTGANTKVGVIDTGISPNQDNFSSDLNSGMSSGRSAQKDGTYASSWLPWADPDGPDDLCGHGTSMSGMVAAPRNAENVPTGVAYNCDLYTIRGTEDVMLDGYSEQDGVAEAIRMMADDRKLKVISMSLGNIISVSKIADAVKYAVNKKGKLFFAAGGTSTFITTWYGVIFPASMNETVAVTGVTDAANYKACEVCHIGDKIDFTIIMQRDHDADRTSVSLGYDGNTANYVGGSSIATATTAGIAALIWSKNPSWKKDKVYNKLKESSDLYPNKSDDFGWGNIDALEALQ